MLVRPDSRRKLILGTAYRPHRRGAADPEADFSDLEAQYQRLCIRDVDPGPFSQSRDSGIFGKKSRDFPGCRD